MQADKVALAEKDEVAVVSKAAVSAEHKAVAARLEAVEATLAALQAQMLTQADANGSERNSGSSGVRSSSSNSRSSSDYSDGAGDSVANGSVSSSSVSRVSDGVQMSSQRPVQPGSFNTVSGAEVSTAASAVPLAPGADTEHTESSKSWPRQVIGMFQRAPWQVAGAPPGGLGSAKHAKDPSTGGIAGRSGH